MKEAELVVQAAPDFKSVTFNMTSSVVGRNRRTVTIFSEPLPRQQAEAACKRQGRELFIATNLQDLCKVSNAAAKAMAMLGIGSMSDMWLGAMRRASTEDWVWGTSAIAQQGRSLGALRVRAAPWSPAEPDGRIDEEVCLELNVRSSLMHSAWISDEGCSMLRAYACSSTWL